MKARCRDIILLCVFLCAFASLRENLFAHQQPTLDFDTPDFKLRLSPSSQTVAALEPKSAPGFDFTPSDRLAQRSANRYHHLGDLILRVRAGNSGPWLNYDTAESRAPVKSNIDHEGFASVAFHSFPSTLKWDPYSGDYGPNFFGHAFNAASYVIRHTEFGWQSFGGNVSVSGEWVSIEPLDSFRQHVYIAPLGLWLTLDAGTFERIAINTRSNIVRVTLSHADRFTPNARLRIASAGTYAPRGNFVNERDAFTIPLKSSATTIELNHR